MDVQKYGIVLPVSEPRYSDLPSFRKRMDEWQARWLAMTPEERVAAWEKQKREGIERRTAIRAEKTVEFGTPQDLMRAVYDRMSWPSGYLHHLAQPYCECGPERDDGWSFCDHARDLWPDIE